MQRHYSLLDKVLIQTNAGLNTVFGQYHAERPNPAAAIANPDLSAKEIQHSAALMRVNHSGEVCAQALYRGQLNFADSLTLQTMLKQAAQEETDHLAWCDERLRELKSHRSFLNFFWYWNSFALGSLAALIGDRWSLGFLEETEIQVEKHLQKHCHVLPAADLKSLMIVRQMKFDEARHSHAAHTAGAAPLPNVIKQLMRFCAKIMTHSSYFI